MEMVGGGSEETRRAAATMAMSTQPIGYNKFIYFGDDTLVIFWDPPKGKTFSKALNAVRHMDKNFLTIIKNDAVSTMTIFSRSVGRYGRDAMMASHACNLVHFPHMVQVGPRPEDKMCSVEIEITPEVTSAMDSKEGGAVIWFIDGLAAMQPTLWIVTNDSVTRIVKTVKLGVEVKRGYHPGLPPAGSESREIADAFQSTLTHTSGAIIYEVQTNHLGNHGTHASSDSLLRMGFGPDGEALVLMVGSDTGNGFSPYEGVAATRIETKNVTSDVQAVTAPAAATLGKRKRGSKDKSTEQATSYTYDSDEEETGGDGDDDDDDQEPDDDDEFEDEEIAKKREQRRQSKKKATGSSSSGGGSGGGTGATSGIWVVRDNRHCDTRHNSTDHTIIRLKDYQVSLAAVQPWSQRVRIVLTSCTDDTSQGSVVIAAEVGWRTTHYILPRVVDGSGDD